MVLASESAPTAGGLTHATVPSEAMRWKPVSLGGLFGPLKGLIGNSLLDSPFKRGVGGGGEGGKIKKNN